MLNSMADHIRDTIWNCHRHKSCWKHPHRTHGKAWDGNRLIIYCSWISVSGVPIGRHINRSREHIVPKLHQLSLIVGFIQPVQLKLEQLHTQTHTHKETDQQHLVSKTSEICPTHLFNFNFWSKYGKDFYKIFTDWTYNIYCYSMINLKAQKREKHKQAYIQCIFWLSSRPRVYPLGL